MRSAKEAAKKRIKKNASLQMVQQEEDKEHLEGKSIGIDQKLINLILILGKSSNQTINQKQVYWILRQLGYSDQQIQIIIREQPKVVGFEKPALKYKRLRQVLIHYPRQEKRKEHYFNSISNDKKLLNIKDFDSTWSFMSPEVKEHINKDTFSYIINEFGKSSSDSVNFEEFSNVLQYANKLCPWSKSSL